MTRENSKSVRRGKLGRRSVLASGGGVAAAASFGFPSIAQSSLRGTWLTGLSSYWVWP